jgi:hypothetical protein
MGSLFRSVRASVASRSWSEERKRRAFEATRLSQIRCPAGCNKRAFHWDDVTMSLKSPCLQQRGVGLVPLAWLEVRRPLMHEFPGNFTTASIRTPSERDSTVEICRGWMEAHAYLPLLGLGNRVCGRCQYTLQSSITAALCHCFEQQLEAFDMISAVFVTFPTHSPPSIHSGMSHA